LNPLDTSEFTTLINRIKKELPLFTRDMVSMKADHGQLPKNVGNHSNKLNEKFLDHNLDIIDEIKHRDKKNRFVKRFENYETKFFNIAPASCISTAVTVYPSISIDADKILNPALTSAACIPTTEVSSRTSGTDDQAENNQIVFNQMLSTVAVGSLLCQVALKRGSAGTGGSYRQGVYNQSGSAPSALLAETGSISMPDTGTYTYQNLTETETDTETLWQAFMQTSTTPKVLRYQGSSTGELYYRNSYTYGGLPDPSGSTASGNPFVTKIGLIDG